MLRVPSLVRVLVTMLPCPTVDLLAWGPHLEPRILTLIDSPSIAPARGFFPPPCRAMVPPQFRM
jgi:hypothetical protein